MITLTIESVKTKYHADKLPTFIEMSVSKYVWYGDPSNPSAPPTPQPVVSVDKRKGGFLHRVIGGKDIVWREMVRPLRKNTTLTFLQPQPEMSSANPFQLRPMPQPPPMGTAGNSHSAAQGLGSGAPTRPPAVTGPTYVGSSLTPLPNDFMGLSWREGRYWEKMRAEQIKAAKEWEKGERNRLKAEEIERRQREKATMKQYQRDLKYISPISYLCPLLTRSGNKRRCFDGRGNTPVE